MDTSTWRGQVQLDKRRIIVNKILDKLKSGYRLVDIDEHLELQKIAQSIEQKSFAGATSKYSYLQNIAVKMVSFEKAREREWKNQLFPESRQRIVNKIVETLRRHFPVSGPEELQHIWMLAQSIEEKIFTIATSQSDYLRKISLKMLTLEMTASRPQHGEASNQNVIGPDDEPSTSVDMNLRNQNN